MNGDSEGKSDVIVVSSALENAIDSLETAATFTLRPDSFKWKWIAISIHHALYMMSIVALRYGTNDCVTTKGGSNETYWVKIGDSKRWMKSETISVEGGPAYRIEWTSFEGEPVFTSKKQKGKAKLISFFSSLARVQDGYYWMGRMSITKPLVLSDEELKLIEWLTLAVRNDFVHYVPKGYLIGVDDVRSSSLVAVKAIRFLAFESYAIWFVKEGWRDRVENALKVLEEFLDA